MDSADAQKQRTNPLTILQRIVKNDRTAIGDCIDTYGNLIWALARKSTDSPEEAEKAVRVIFLDIWQYAARYKSADFDEVSFITLVAYRRLSRSSKEFSNQFNMNKTKNSRINISESLHNTNQRIG